MKVQLDRKVGIGNKKINDHGREHARAIGHRRCHFKQAARRRLQIASGAFGLTASDLAALGVRRISVGGSLARVAMAAFIRTATEIARDGKFDGFAGLISNAELNEFFSKDRKTSS